jgi:hypothetical protein
VFILFLLCGFLALAFFPFAPELALRFISTANVLTPVLAHLAASFSSASLFP